VALIQRLNKWRNRQLERETIGGSNATAILETSVSSDNQSLGDDNSSSNVSTSSISINDTLHHEDDDVQREIGLYKLDESSIVTVSNVVAAVGDNLDTVESIVAVTSVIPLASSTVANTANSNDYVVPTRLIDSKLLMTTIGARVALIVAGTLTTGIWCLCGMHYLNVLLAKA
jgi:hypothetical protein